MKLLLEQERWFGQSGRWKESLPFVENKAGILIHRPRKVNCHNKLTNPHISITYYCGGMASGNFEKLTFLSEPAETDLLCAACEARAVMAGLPTASDLAGRHVHIGKLKAIKVCCNETH